VKISHTLAFVPLAILSSSCAHTTPTSAPGTSPGVASAGAPTELWCGPVTCPTWLAKEPAITALPLRERCNLLSKVLMFQPLTLVGRPLSAAEASQRGVGTIAKRMAAAVLVREDAQTLGQSWFAAGETCGAGVIVLAPSTTRAEYEEANSVFRLMLTPATPGSVSAFEFELTAEPLRADVSTAAWIPLRGRVERGAQTIGPDTWKVTQHANVNAADALKD
jgi:hypothetical protein